MDNHKKYYAFISYKREDKKEAKWLQHALEYYRLPNQLRQHDSKLPEYVRPIFRDMTDLEVGELSAQIHSALEQSHYLIVVCSPRTAASKWVNDEIEYFISLGKQDKIIPYIIEGIPHASNPEEECYPPALLRLYKDKELLGANINEVGKDSATIRIVSRMFDIRFDTLYQRYQREQKRRRRQLTVAIILAFLFLSGIAGWIWHQNVLLKEREWKMMENQSRAICEKACELISDGDVYRGLFLAKEIYPHNNNRPWIPEIERTIYAAIDSINNGEGCLLQMKRHYGAVLDADLSNDILVSSSNDKTVRFWDTETGSEIIDLRLTIECGSISEVAISPNKEWLVTHSGGYGYTENLTLWKYSINGYKKYRTLGEGYSPHFSSDGNIFTAYMYNENGKSQYSSWNTNGWKKINDQEGVCYFYNNSRTIQIRIFEKVENGNPKNIIQISKPLENWMLAEYVTDQRLNSYSCIISDDSKYAAIKIGSKILLFNIEKAIIQVELYAPDADSFIFSSDGKYIIATNYLGPNEKGIIRFFDVFTGKEDCDKQIILERPARKLIASEDNNFLFYCGSNGIINKIRMPWYAKASHKEVLMQDSIGYVRYSPNGNYFLSSDLCFLYISDKTSKKRRKVLDFSMHDFSYWAISSDGKHIATISNFSKIVSIWDAQTGNLIKTGFEHNNHIWSVSFSNNGHYLVTGDRDELVHVWDFNNGTEVCHLSGHSNGVVGAIFYDNDTKIMSRSYDGTVRFWDLKERKEMLEHRIVQSGSLFSCAIDEKCQYVCTSDNEYIRIWDYNTRTLLRTIPFENAIEIWFDNPNNRLIVLKCTNARNTEIELHSLWEMNPVEGKRAIDDIGKKLKAYYMPTEEKRQYYLE